MKAILKGEATGTLTREALAERQKQLEAELAVLLAEPCPPPKSKARLTEVTRVEFNSPEVLRVKADRERQRLMEAERCELERIKQQRRVQEALDYWMESRTAIDEHERWLLRQADPDNIGHWHTAPCHRD